MNDKQRGKMFKMSIYDCNFQAQRVKSATIIYKNSIRYTIRSFDLSNCPIVDLTLDRMNFCLRMGKGSFVSTCTPVEIINKTAWQQTKILKTSVYLCTHIRVDNFSNNTDVVEVEKEYCDKKGDTNEERPRRKEKKKKEENGTQREILPVGEIHRENGVERKDEKHNNKEDEGGGWEGGSNCVFFIISFHGPVAELR